MFKEGVDGVKTNYFKVTEHPGLGATREQLERLCHRYYFVRGHVEKKDVLEVACGTGIGLPYLAERANKVVGVDIDEKNLEMAKKVVDGDNRVVLVQADAHNLPFKKDSFDVVLLYEAIYYLQNPADFVREAYRGLRDNGLLVICSVNKLWRDFHPSPYTHSYFSIQEMASLLEDAGFKVSGRWGAFKISTGVRDYVIFLIKKIALRFNLIPGTLQARTILKRIFMGKLRPLPSRISAGMVEYLKPSPIVTDRDSSEFKILYVVGKKA